MASPSRPFPKGQQHHNTELQPVGLQGPVFPWHFLLPVLPSAIFLAQGGCAKGLEAAVSPPSQAALEGMSFGEPVAWYFISSVHFNPQLALLCLMLNTALVKFFFSRTGSTQRPTPASYFKAAPLLSSY